MTQLDWKDKNGNIVDLEQEVFYDYDTFFVEDMYEGTKGEPLLILEMRGRLTKNISPKDVEIKIEGFYKDATLEKFLEILDDNGACVEGYKWASTCEDLRYFYDNVKDEWFLWLFSIDFLSFEDRMKMSMFVLENVKYEGEILRHHILPAYKDSLDLIENGEEEDMVLHEISCVPTEEKWSSYSGMSMFINGSFFDCGWTGWAHPYFETLEFEPVFKKAREILTFENFLSIVEDYEGES